MHEDASDSHRRTVQDAKAGLISVPSSLVALLFSHVQLSPPLSLRVTAHWKTNILTHRTLPTSPWPVYKLFLPPSAQAFLPSPAGDCNHILPAAYSLRAFINVSRLDGLSAGKENKTKQTKH